MFADKTVAITGASSGLGRELSIQLGQSGANLVLFARDEGRLQETARLCGDAGAREPLIVPGDVRQPEESAAMVAAATERFGQIDWLVANAGISMWSRFEEIEDLSVFEKLMETNFLGAVYSIHAALPEIRKARGGIAVVASIQAKFGVPFHSAYSASKHALDGFCDALRTEINGSGVHLLMAYPHWMSGTNLREHALGKSAEEIGRTKRSHSSDAISADVCAKKIIRAMARRRAALYIPGKLRLLPWLKLIAPGFLRRLVTKRVNRQSK